AELGAGAAITPVADDLAVDGVDELLKVFVAYSFSKWPEDFTEALKDFPDRAFLIRASAATGGIDGSWLVKTGTDQLTVEGGPGSRVGARTPDVTINGTAADVLRWAWNRETPGEAGRVRIEGNTQALSELRRCVVEATQ
ncbi:MAG: maleylpyruvate isomerase family mycothiol-dependent enzyme, partial [Trebonia sp.]